MLAAIALRQKDSAPKGSMDGSVVEQLIQACGLHSQLLEEWLRGEISRRGIEPQVIQLDELRAILSEILLDMSVDESDGLAV